MGPALVSYVNDFFGSELPSRFRGRLEARQSLFSLPGVSFVSSLHSKSMGAHRGWARGSAQALPTLGVAAP